MRRVMVMAAVMALLASAMSGTALAGRAGKTPAGVNPHFIIDETGVRLVDSSLNGDLEFYFKVAGLGKNGAADIEARGGLTLLVGCEYPRGSGVTRTVEPRAREQRVNVRTEYADSSGNAIGTRELQGRGACSRNGTAVWVYGEWDNIQVAIYNANHVELVNETRTLESFLDFCYGTVDLSDFPGYPDTAGCPTQP